MLDKMNLEIELPSDSLDRVKVVENWFHALDNKWNVMRKQQKATMKKVEEVIFEEGNVNDEVR